MYAGSLVKKCQCVIIRLACFLVFASSNSPAAGDDPASGEYVYAEPNDEISSEFQEINSTYDLFIAMAQALELSFTGLYNLTEYLEPKDIGMAQEIVRRCEKRSEIPACDELDPIEMKRIRAVAESGASRFDIAEMLGNAADGVLGAGKLLETGIAQEIGIAPTRIGRYASRVAAEDPAFGVDALKSRCDAAEAVSIIRTGEDAESQERRRETEAPGEFQGQTTLAQDRLLMAESYISPIAMMTEASCILLTASRDLTNAQGRNPYETDSWGNLEQLVEQQILFQGIEQLGPGPAYHLSLDTPGMTETIEGQGGPHFHVDRIDRWIDTEHLTETKTRISGRITTDPDWWRDQTVPDTRNRAGTRMRRGEVREVFMEKELGDFRWLPGTRMYHPFRMTSRVGGLLSEDELEEMSEAAESLDEIEAQMAAMPPRERQRMEQMMGPRIEKLRNMVDSGVFEFTLITKRVLVNTDAGEVLAGRVGYEPKLLIQEIQSNLNTLGYYLGAFDGELRSETVAAIIRYQRDYQLELTGRPTPELARIISATLSAVR